MSVFFLLIVRFGSGSDRCGVPMSCAYRSPPEVAQAIAKTEINALRYLLRGWSTRNIPHPRKFTICFAINTSVTKGG
jgi:hypothetical protein